LVAAATVLPRTCGRIPTRVTHGGVARPPVLELQRRSVRRSTACDDCTATALLSPFHRFTAQALHREPELRRVIRYREVDRLVRDEIARPRTSRWSGSAARMPRLRSPGVGPFRPGPIRRCSTCWWPIPSGHTPSCSGRSRAPSSRSFTATSGGSAKDSGSPRCRPAMSTGALIEHGNSLRTWP
jgi:hypothetical protein